MSMRTSVQKRDEKQPTFDDIKKIGYLMRVKNTAMKEDASTPTGNKRRASPKTTPPTAPGGAGLGPTPTTPPTEPGRVSSILCQYNDNSEGTNAQKQGRKTLNEKKAAMTSKSRETTLKTCDFQKIHHETTWKLTIKNHLCRGTETC